jgi:hypothetical protein
LEKLVEAGVLRFSHGFIPLEFEERKGGPMARFNVLKFDIVEESLVSVPSNMDAEIELFSRGKLTSEPFKNHAKALFDARKTIVGGADIISGLAKSRNVWRRNQSRRFLRMKPALSNRKRMMLLPVVCRGWRCAMFDGPTVGASTQEKLGRQVHRLLSQGYVQPRDERQRYDDWRLSLRP